MSKQMSASPSVPETHRAGHASFLCVSPQSTVLQNVIADSLCWEYETPHAHTGPCPSGMEVPLLLGCTATSHEKHVQNNNSQASTPGKLELSCSYGAPKCPAQCLANAYEHCILPVFQCIS